MDIGGTVGIAPLGVQLSFRGCGRVACQNHCLGEKGDIANGTKLRIKSYAPADLLQANVRPIGEHADVMLLHMTDS